jgi:hypothetical protein
MLWSRKDGLAVGKKAIKIRLVPGDGRRSNPGPVEQVAALPGPANLTPILPVNCSQATQS